MNSNRYSLCNFFLLSLLSLFVLLVCQNTAYAKPVKVAVVPFKINAENELSFLQNGIFDMLSSSLSKEGEVLVTDKKDVEDAIGTSNTPFTEEKARAIGLKLGVDYVLFGTLTVFGNSASIDTKIVDAKEAKPPLALLNQTQKTDDVITNINLFAKEINKRLSVGNLSIEKTPAQIQTTQPDQTNTIQKIDASISETRNVYENDAFVPTSKGKSRKFIQNLSLKKTATGLAIGDVNGDGQTDTVITTPHSVYVYRFVGKQLLEKKEIANLRKKNIIGVDVADINKNGIDEIFITSLNSAKDGVNSLVLEYNGEKYATITDRKRLYFRVVVRPDQGKVLFGQPQKGPEPFLDVIYKMNWQNSQYESGKKIKIPEKISLMGFTAGDVMNTGTESYIAFDRNDNICMVDSNSGDLIWKGREQYGGSTLSFVSDGGIYDDAEGFMFFPMRTFIMDLDSDGKNEVITVNNTEVAGRVLKRFRKFKDSQIIALSWDGTGMSIGWETHKTSGFFRDFAVGDFNNDKKEELVAVLIIKESTLMGRTPKSAIIAYDISKN